MSEQREKVGDVFLEVLEADALAQEETSEGTKVTLGGSTFLTLLCC